MIRKEDFEGIDKIISPEVKEKLVVIEKTYEFKRLSLEKMLLRTMRSDSIQDAADVPLEQKEPQVEKKNKKS